VPDKNDGDFAGILKYLIDYPIITDTNPVKILGTRKFVGSMGQRINSELFNLLKNGGKKVFGNFPEIFFNALFDIERIRSHDPDSHHTLFQLIKTYGTFVPALSNHGKIVEIFFQVLVLRERKNDGDLIAVLVNNILLDSTHWNS